MGHLDFTDKVFVRRYDTVHKWITYHYGPAAKCEQCKKPGLTYQWSNKTRLYKKDRADWQELCISCHRKYDVTPEFREQARIKRLNGVPLHIKAIEQYDLDGNLLATYASAVEAEKYTGILRSSICNNLKRKTRHAGGFSWHYVDEKEKRLHN